MDNGRCFFLTVMSCAVFLFSGMVSVVAGGKSAGSLEREFDNPSEAARPSCFWWWLNSLVDKEAITANLEELSDKGIGEVILICSSNWGVDASGQVPEKGPEFLSPEWLELFRHTLDEARRLQMKVGVNFCASGWTVGGPWIGPETNGRWFVHSETEITGPVRYSGKLPLPDPRGGYKPPYHFNVARQMEWPKEKMDYRDNAVLAFRTDGKVARIDDQTLLDAKSNRRDSSPYITSDSLVSPLIQRLAPSAGGTPLASGDVLDVTGFMKEDGTFEWEVPEGEWTVFRIGHVATGAPLVCILPEMDEGALAIDWLKKESIDTMFSRMGDILIKNAGKKHLGKTLTYFHTDSYEDGYPNWSDSLLYYFEKYRGYDPRPYLPVFAGYVVENEDVSDRFLNDYRKTAADMFADNSFGYMSERLARYGLFLESEAGGPSWSGTVCIDALKNLGRVARPMGEFWNGCAFIDENDQNDVCKQTSSAAHIYGRKIASAEAFTDVSHWTEYPAALKPVADRAFCEGINKISFHTITLQRSQDGKPGYEYGAGTHFNPNVTWWDIGAEDWVAYLTRCSAMLQSGMFVADVLFYNGDWCPNVVKGDYAGFIGADGYDCDVCNEEVLLERLSVDGSGNIVLPDGMKYRVLVLPDTDVMSIAALRKIGELVRGGAVVCGPKPVRNSTLEGYPESDREMSELADAIWGAQDGCPVYSYRYGKGMVFCGWKVSDVLAELGIGPDFRIEKRNIFPGYRQVASTEEHPGTFSYASLRRFESGPLHPDSTYIDYIHRRTEEQDIYFVVNRKNKKEFVNASFRVSGCAPQLWNPVTGERRVLPEYAEKDGRCIVPLCFDAYDSFFIVFDRKTGYPDVEGKNFYQYETLMTLDDAVWRLTFDEQWLYHGKDSSVEPVFSLDSLIDLTTYSSDAVKYYSGTVKYETTFNFSGYDGDRDVFLDLGEVAVLAKVKLNGKDLGTVWRPPYRVDVSDCLHKGENRLVVEVADLWINRLLGDELLPVDKRRTSTNIEIKNYNESLKPSGLIGPVSLSVMEDEW